MKDSGRNRAGGIPALVARGLTAGAAVLGLAACTHGPPVDRSKFESAAVIRDGHAVVFSAHLFVYRPATGLNAFPDGGLPMYVSDRDIVGVFDVDAQETRVLVDEPNRDWAPGQGVFQILGARGAIAFLSRGGQVRRAYERGQYVLESRFYFLDLDTGDLRAVDLSGDLATRGRALGQYRLVDARGTLLFICPSVEEAKRDPNWQRDARIKPEIWVRKGDGEYARAAPGGALFERYEDGRVIWWSPDDRQYRAYDTATGETRVLEGYKPPERVPMQSTATVSTSGDRIQIGYKVDRSWDVHTLPVDLSSLGKAGS